MWGMRGAGRRVKGKGEGERRKTEPQGHRDTEKDKAKAAFALRATVCCRQAGRLKAAVGRTCLLSVGIAPLYDETRHSTSLTDRRIVMPLDYGHAEILRRFAPQHDRTPKVAAISSEAKHL